VTSIWSKHAVHLDLYRDLARKIDGELVAAEVSRQITRQEALRVADSIGTLLAVGQDLTKDRKQGRLLRKKRRAKPLREKEAEALAHWRRQRANLHRRITAYRERLLTAAEPLLIPPNVINAHCFQQSDSIRKLEVTMEQQYNMKPRSRRRELGAS